MTHQSRRLAAGLLVGGAVLLIIGNTLHPVDATPSPTSRLALAGAGSWIWIHLVIAAGVLAVTAGIVLARRSFHHPRGASLAHLASVAAVIGGGILAVVFAALDGYGISSLASQWVAGDEAHQLAVEGAAIALDAADTGMAALGLMLLFGISLGGLGMAILLDGGLPRWVGWVLVPVGVLGLVTGVTLAVLGPTTFTINWLLRPSAMVTTACVVVFAVALGRSASHDAMVAGVS